MASAGMFQLFNLPEMLVELQARRIATSNSFAFNSSSGKYLDLFAHLLQQHTSHIAGVSTRTPKTSLLFHRISFSIRWAKAPQSKTEPLTQGRHPHTSPPQL